LRGESIGFKKVKGTEERLDIQEAFNIYNLLRERYLSTQTIQLFKNFVHNAGWEIILDGFKKHFEKEIAIFRGIRTKISYHPAQQISAGRVFY